MLWTDTWFVTSADMAVIDPEVADVAAAENITVDGPQGIVQRTIDECSGLLWAQLQRFGGYLSSGLISANQLQAVFNTGGPGVNRVRLVLGQIMVFDNYAPQMKNWITYLTLKNFFRTAANKATGKNGDRYETKQKKYQTDVDYVYWPTVQNQGIATVYRQMSCPGAVNERNAGDWGSGNVTTVASSGTAGGRFDVAITYVDQSFYRGPSLKQKANAESYVSARVTFTVAADQAIQVSIAGLNPPHGRMNPADLGVAISTPLNASGWNVYVGEVGGTLYLQNSTPTPITTPTYALAADPVLSGWASDWGQYANNYFTIPDIVQRG
jgi:hypothetical protein